MPTGSTQGAPFADEHRSHVFSIGTIPRPLCRRPDPTATGAGAGLLARDFVAALLFLIVGAPPSRDPGPVQNQTDDRMTCTRAARSCLGTLALLLYVASELSVSNWITLYAQEELDFPMVTATATIRRCRWG